MEIAIRRSDINDAAPCQGIRSSVPARAQKHAGVGTSSSPADGIAECVRGRRGRRPTPSHAVDAHGVDNLGWSGGKESSGKESSNLTTNEQGACPHAAELLTLCIDKTARRDATDRVPGVRSLYCGRSISIRSEGRVRPFSLATSRSVWFGEAWMPLAFRRSIPFSMSICCSAQYCSIVMRPAPPPPP